MFQKGRGGYALNNLQKVCILRIGPNLPLSELVELLYFWKLFIYIRILVGRNSITDWKNFLHDLCVEVFFADYWKY